MKYRPYCWLGEDQDAHVVFYRGLEAARRHESSGSMLSMFRPGVVTMLNLAGFQNTNLAQLRNGFMHSAANGLAGFLNKSL